MPGDSGFEQTEFERKIEEIKLREERIRLREGLPFLHGWKWYPWARDFFESTNKLNFLCAANQISKSSTQIRKCIDWATNQVKWESLWARRPVQFWYLYPTQKQVESEFVTKWQQFLPRGEFKERGPYAWKELRKNKDLIGLHFFEAGVFVFFKTYAQDVSSLQTGTCDAIFCDEELPVDLYDELIFRVSASDGYFHMVFTATLGQEFWREVIEEKGDKEKLVGAAKWQVSMYDCIEYEDGTPSHWSEEKIQIVKNRCKTHNEVLRRVYGRFVVDSGRKYEQFDLKRHMIAPKKVSDDWLFYAGVDTGSGGTENHPAAICFVAVRPDFRYGEVFMGWRGDGKDTTATDILLKFIQMKNGRALSGQYYDWADKDFDMISTRMHEPFQKADKSHDKGEEVINVLFKNNMLFVHTNAELEKLAWELSNLRLETNKRKAKDDFCDALRYAITRIPWDWSAITGDAPTWEPKKAEPVKSEYELQVEERRSHMFLHEDENLIEQQRIEQEIDEWNDLY
jgi:phage terminase large subunit-like protein